MSTKPNAIRIDSSSQPLPEPKKDSLELGWSSWHRARVQDLMRGINTFLGFGDVQKALALVNKGYVAFEIRDGKVVQVTIDTNMRVGKELRR